MLLLSLLAFWVTNSYAIAFNSSTPATRTSSVPSTITPGPDTTNSVAINTCSYYNETESRTLWNDPWCSMYAGTVDLVYWPTDNNSYPSTYYDDEYDYTYSSPSVYMVVNTLYGWNSCGMLGPSTSREIFAFDLTEVSTLVPYSDTSATTTRRATRQLFLSDLDTHCTASFNRTELATQTNPVKDDDTRCNPFLVVPADVKRYGYPYWLHCGIKNNKFGLFDPPYAIPAVEDLVPTEATTTTTAVETSSTEDPTAAQSASTKATAPTEPAAPTADPDNTSSSDASAQQTDPATVNPESTIANDSSTSALGDDIVTNPGTTEAAAALPSDSKSSTEAPTDDVNTQPSAATNAAYTSVTGVEAQFDPIADSNAVVSTVSKLVASLGTNGLEVVNPDTGKTSTYGNTVLATTAVYGGQTLTLGGPAVVVTNVVVIVSPSSANPTSAEGAEDAVGPNVAVVSAIPANPTSPTDAASSGSDTEVFAVSPDPANPTSPTDAASSGSDTEVVAVSPGPANPTSPTGAASSGSNTDVAAVSPDPANPTSPTDAASSGSDTEVVAVSPGPANPTSPTDAASSGSGSDTDVVAVSPSPANPTSPTDATGSSASTPTATPSTVLVSSANRIPGSVVQLLLALMTSIWV